MTYRTDSPMVGAERVAYRQHSHNPTMYRHHDVTDSLEDRRADLKALVADIARFVHDEQAITKREKSACQEAMRGNMSLNAFDILVDLVARSSRPFMLEEGFRGLMMQRIARPSPLSVVDTWLVEGRKQNDADEAHDQFIVERIPARRDQALDRLVPHYDALRQAIDALHRWSPNGRVLA